MADAPLYVVARIVAKAGYEDRVKALLQELIEPTRQEAGCMRYELCQSPAIATEFVFLEVWRSEAEMEAHLDSDHVQEALLESGEFLAEPPEIRRYQVLQ
jgi:quinol monooxygenase YgiN